MIQALNKVILVVGMAAAFAMVCFVSALALSATQRVQAKLIASTRSIHPGEQAAKHAPATNFNHHLLAKLETMMTLITKRTDLDPEISPEEIDPRIFDLYDEYCHGTMSRRDFLSRASALGIVGGLAMAQLLVPNYAKAQTISFTDKRIRAKYVKYASPGGNSGEMRGYLVQPAGDGPFPSVLIVHENRGLNPYIEDVARRAAVAGFLALAPDALSPLGGYPGNEDDGKVLQRKLDRGKIFLDMLNSARWVKQHKLSNGKLGATGFCFGGGVANFLATEMGADIQASVPFYGAAAKIDEVPNIKAAMLIQYAEDDKRVNAQRPAYEKALKAAGVDYQMHVYEGTRHGFHNNSTPRYNEEQAKIAWERTIAHWRKHLA